MDRKALLSGRVRASTVEKFQEPTIVQLKIKGLTASKISIIEQVANKNKTLYILIQETHCTNLNKMIGSMVEWLKSRGLWSTWSRFKIHSRHSVVSLKKTFYGTFSCLVVLEAVLNYSHISIKLQADSNILASPNCLSNVLAPPSLSCESGE